ncbi:MAG: GNAT family N-acetyltransferase [Candidatus Riflebacteria bacterium]|nr:GNAT family N-acetyltransferase [Candidatus Riflebacteria bacterium]
MKLVEIGKDTEGTFFRCMHDERPENPGETQLRRRWYEKYKTKGLRAKVLLNNDDKVVGLCQYLPIEHSNLLGENLFTILCIAIHGYEHLIGNQQGKGYGKFMLNCIEQDAKDSGAIGIAVRADEFPEQPKFSSAPFYDHMGYSRLEKRGFEVLVWKPFAKNAQAPSLLHPNRTPTKSPEKNKLTVFSNGWCMIDCRNCNSARNAVVGIENQVIYEEIDTSERANMLSHGIEEGVFLNGSPFKNFGDRWTSEELRDELLRLSK